MGEGFKRIGWKNIALVAATAAFMWFLLFAPSPYVIYEPGIAAGTCSMVTMGPESNGEIPVMSNVENGAFLMTTVKLTDTNYWGAIRATWQRDAEAMSKTNILKGYTDQQYQQRMNVIMHGSQNDAIEAAYRFAHVPYHTVPAGVMVSSSSRSENGLLPGDSIIKAEAKEVAGLEDLAAVWRTKQAGNQVQLTVLRNESELDLTMSLEAFNGTLTKERLSLALGGAQLSEYRELAPIDGNLALSINAGEIGGPSAGLMFALQSLDLLTDGDLTGGQIIAGTGTIDPTGKVGEIGGIGYKIVAAHQAGAKLFLAPAGNYEEAVKKAKRIRSSMQVVRVSTLKEAVVALEAVQSAKS
ncbi:PDZ domain-containing protein [Paenibacillus gorillae]|uniref:YlbL family protein n=1 Tax=Paenibacillus gorillae TaxID=1243662 RepID=UPI0004BCE299|nr:S16 family serine protease [Paenibacillus gorillae]